MRAGDVGQTHTLNPVIRVMDALSHGAAVRDSANSAPLVEGPTMRDERLAYMNLMVICTLRRRTYTFVDPTSTLSYQCLTGVSFGCLDGSHSFLFSFSLRCVFISLHAFLTQFPRVND